MSAKEAPAALTNPPSPPSSPKLGRGRGAGGEGEGAPVPRLDLAPKLKRPLQLWNPLDYVRLLYWCFFFPQAIRWYVETFADPQHRKARGRGFLSGLRRDPVQRHLALMGFLLILIVPLTPAVYLELWGVPILWPAVAVWIAFGALVGLMVGVTVLGIAGGLAPCVAFMTAAGVACGIAGAVIGMLLGIANATTGGSPLGEVLAAMYGSEGYLVGIAFVIVAGGVSLGMAGGLAVSAALGVESGLVIRFTYIVTFGASSTLVSGVAFGVLWGILGGIGVGVAEGITITVGELVAAIVGVVAVFATMAVVCAVTFAVTLLRPLDCFLPALLGDRVWPQERHVIGHTTWLPMPRTRNDLTLSLAQDWITGVHNINQLLAYTLQFISAVQAVTSALACLPDDQVLSAVADLTLEPFDWQLVAACSASLRDALWNEAFAGLLIVPRRLRCRWQARFPADLRLDTPARAACAGFWYLHTRNLMQAIDAFSVVRHLPGGKELYLTATSLAAAQDIDDISTLGQWREVSTRLTELPEPYLRPTVVATLRRLRDVAQEADVAVHAVSPLMRSSAIGRAVAALTQLLVDVEGTCPEPERAIVRQVAEQWRDVLARAGGQIGAEVLRQPVENPYEGYSGLPVERTFVGRETILAQLEKLWATSPDAPLPPIILYGHRRMGKTSIVRHLYRHRGSATLVAPVDMQDLLLADHTGQLLQGFARAIHAAVQEARLDAGPVPAASDYATTGTARESLNALLERLAPQMEGRRLILAVDEYELAEAKIAAGKFDPDFLRYLRAAAQRHRWLGLLFAGRQTLEDELRHYKAVFYGSAEPLRVSFLAREAALQLIRVPSDDFALEHETALAEELYRLTHGQPYLLQRLCWELVNRWNDRFLHSVGRDGIPSGRDGIPPRTLTLADLDALLTPAFYRDFFLQADYYFSGVWDEAGPNERRLLAALAARADDAPVSQDGLIQAAGLDPVEAVPALEAALRHDFIAAEVGETHASPLLRLAVPLMRQWIQMQ